MWASRGTMRLIRTHGESIHLGVSFGPFFWSLLLICTSSSTAKEDSWRYEFERLPTWQDVLQRGRAHCQSHHDHGSEDINALVLPSRAIVYADEPVAAAAARALGLEVIHLKDLYAPDDEPDEPAPRRADSRRADSVPPIPISSGSEGAATPSISTVSSLSASTSGSGPSFSASAARFKPARRQSATRFEPARGESAAAPVAMTPTLWINEYTHVVYADGCVSSTLLTVDILTLSEDPSVLIAWRALAMVGSGQ